MACCLFCKQHCIFNALSKVVVFVVHLGKSQQYKLSYSGKFSREKSFVDQ